MNILVNFFFKFGYSVSYKFIDRGIFELLGPTGLSFSAVGAGSEFYRKQTGYMYHYTYSVLVSLTSLLLFRELSVFFGPLFDVRFFFVFIVLCLILMRTK